MNKMIGLETKRKEFELSQSKLAAATGIERETLAFFESGKCSPDIETLKKLSNFFSCSIDYLINGKEFGK